MATNPNVSMVSGGILTLTSWLLAVRLPDRGCSQVLLVWSFSGILARRPAFAKKRFHRRADVTGRGRHSGAERRRASRPAGARVEFQPPAML
jgi:hypothetical protein